VTFDFCRNTAVAAAAAVECAAVAAAESAAAAAAEPAAAAESAAVAAAESGSLGTASVKIWVKTRKIVGSATLLFRLRSSFLHE
jgi:hypothetical protein